MKKLELNTYDEFKEAIEEYIDDNFGGIHTHKIVGFKLQSCAAKLGNDAANKIIEELDITNLFGIYPVKK